MLIVQVEIQWYSHNYTLSQRRSKRCFVQSAPRPIRVWYYSVFPSLALSLFLTTARRVSIDLIIAFHQPSPDFANCGSLSRQHAVLQAVHLLALNRRHEAAGD